jgi:hypothetical protein
MQLRLLGHVIFLPGRYIIALQHWNRGKGAVDHWITKFSIYFVDDCLKNWWDIIQDILRIFWLRVYVRVVVTQLYDLILCVLGMQLYNGTGLTCHLGGGGGGFPIFLAVGIGCIIQGIKKKWNWHLKSFQLHFWYYIELKFKQIE